MGVHIATSAIDDQQGRVNRLLRIGQAAQPQIILGVAAVIDPQTAKVKEQTNRIVGLPAGHTGDMTGGDRGDLDILEGVRLAHREGCQPRSRDSPPGHA